MKIALIGYGKMGHAIERYAIARGHEVVARIDRHNPADWDSPALLSADVAIEFTTPATAVDNILRAFSRHIPVVCGTTAWTDSMPRVREALESLDGTLLWSSNFSIGVNIFMALNRYLTSLMADFPQNTPKNHEIHHIHKLEHPRGTALTLAGDKSSGIPALTGWTEEAATAAPGELPVTHERIGEVPGTHSVTWDSEVDRITITHEAKSRDGFALGAVMAAEWLAGKTGYHTIDQFIQELIAQ